MEPSSIFTQERIRIDGSVKNETRHKSLNSMVHKVTQISEELMAVLLDVAIFITNKNLDKKYGRADKHSFGLFLGCSDNDLNAWAADFLDGPVFFPLAQAEVNNTSGFRPPVGSQGSAQVPKLGALKIYNEDAPEYEPMGFDYFHERAKPACCLQCTAVGEPSAADANAPDAVMTVAGAHLTPSSNGGAAAGRAANSSKRQGGVHFSNKRKARRASPLREKPVAPESICERQILKKSMEAVSADTKLPATETPPKRKSKSKKQPLGQSCADYCSRVAEAYNGNVIAMLAGPSPPSKAQLRPAMTTAHLIQKVIEASLLRQQRADRQRDAACETAMVERTELDDAAASQEEEGTPSFALIVRALADAKAYFSVGASASTDLSVETVAAHAAAGSSQCKSPTPVCTQRMSTKRKHAGDASVMVITHAQISSEKKQDHPSLAELQKLNESTVLLNQQGYSKLPVSVRKPQSSISMLQPRFIAVEYAKHA